jgi:hypothetical protein
MHAHAHAQQTLQTFVLDNLVKYRSEIRSVCLDSGLSEDERQTRIIEILSKMDMFLELFGR